MTKYENIPHRVWRRKYRSSPCSLVTQPVYRRVMKRIGDAIAAGKQVDFETRVVNPVAINNQPYDVISVRISE